MPANYREIADAIRAKIASGEWPSGYKLPTKRELAVQWGVSTQTIDMTMVVLRTEGLVEGQQGRGVWVK